MTGQDNKHAPAFDRAFAESLCDLQVPNTIRFSSDGHKVLYSTNLTWNHAKVKNPASTLWLASTSQAESSRQLTSGLFEDRDPQWLPDGKRVAFLSDRAKAGGSSAVWILTVGEDGGGEPYPITSTDNTQRIETFSLCPSGKMLAFISPDEKSSERKEKEEKEDTDAEVWGDDWEYARLQIVDVDSKEVSTVIGDSKHVIEASWSPDGKKLAFQHSQSPDSEEPTLTGTTISTVEVASGQITDLCTIHNELSDLTWAPDGKVYFITGTPAHMAAAGKAVYVVDPEATSPSYTKIAGGEYDDADMIKVCGSEMMVSFQHRLESWIGRLGKEILVKKDTDIEAWDCFFDASSGKSIVAAGLSDINNPSEVFIIRGEETIKLSNHGKQLKGRTFGSSFVLSCPSSDGEVELDGLYLTPAEAAGSDGKPKAPLPTFVMIHGGPPDRNCKCFDSYYFMWAPYILSKGYGVLFPQYRGSLGRGEKFAAYNSGGTGTKAYDDVITITDKAISNGLADANNLIVGGYSQGGFMTFLSAVRNGLHNHGWRFKACIAGAGITDIDSLSLTSKHGSTFDIELNEGRVIWTMERDDVSSRVASAIWEVAGAVRMAKEHGQPVIPPMLIIHGAADLTCPTSQSEGFRRALRAHDLPYEFVCYPRQEHLIKEQKFWIDMLERIGRWCDTYIGPGKPTGLAAR